MLLRNALVDFGSFPLHFTVHYGNLLVFGFWFVVRGTALLF